MLEILTAQQQGAKTQARLLNIFTKAAALVASTVAMPMLR